MAGTRRQMLKMAPLAVAMATGAGATAATAPKVEGKGRCLVLVNAMCGIRAEQVVDALNKRKPVLEHDGLIAHPIEVLWVPDGAEVLDVEFTEARLRFDPWHSLQKWPVRRPYPARRGAE